MEPRYPGFGIKINKNENVNINNNNNVTTRGHIMSVSTTWIQWQDWVCEDMANKLIKRLDLTWVLLKVRIRVPNQYKYLSSRRPHSTDSKHSTSWSRTLVKPAWLRYEVPFKPTTIQPDLFLIPWSWHQSINRLRQCDKKKIEINGKKEIIERKRRKCKKRHNLQFHENRSFDSTQIGT